jgi:endonuclease/exonuclease/phosphatase family metal-dependent hydrolase
MHLRNKPWRGGFRKAVAVAISSVVVLTVGWWFVGRLTLDGRRVALYEWRDVPEVAGVAELPTDSIRTDSLAVDSTATVRVLAWNIAHGRGGVRSGHLQNWRGGTTEERIARLARIAEVIRRADADVVVLNEVDFQSGWSGDVNQAEVLARSAGYGTWVEQRNYDLRLPFWTLSFGNAVLTRLPVRHVEGLDLPPHSALEAWLFGAKTASLVRLETPIGSLALVPVHLEVRSEVTRLSAIPLLDSLRVREPAPLVLAGDFNSSPLDWPGAGERTALGALLEGGWQGLRALLEPGASQWTFPTYAPERAIDWILAEPPLRVVAEHVLPDAGELSDHQPIVAEIRRAGGGTP